jgi:hypothetical protein
VIITIGRDLTTGEVVIRNHENETVINLDPDPEMFNIFTEMVVDQLNDLDPDTEYMLEEVDR